MVVLMFFFSIIYTIFCLVWFAQKKLIMVGSQRTLSKVPLLMLLLKKVKEQSGILTLSPGDLKP